MAVSNGAKQYRPFSVLLLSGNFMTMHLFTYNYYAVLESFFGNRKVYGTRIGFIGLGKLGMPCAEAIAKKGFDVAGYDIDHKSSNHIEIRENIEDVRDRNKSQFLFASKWIGMNVLSLSPDTVVVDDIQIELATQLEKNGFNVVKTPMRHSRTLGGGFHCVTCDIERTQT